MLTEGDRVTITSGDFAGEAGIVERRLLGGLYKVQLIKGGVGLFAPNLLENQPTDNVRQPSHYTQHPSGVECIDITKHMSFPLGSAVKYIWRADLKGNAIEDLRKAAEYLRIEIEKREAS